MLTLMVPSLFVWVEWKWVRGSILACQELSKRLAPFKEAEPTGVWEQWIGMVYGSRVHLSVFDHYAIPHKFTEYSMEKKEGNCWAYFVNGASCSVVEVALMF